MSEKLPDKLLKLIRKSWEDFQKRRRDAAVSPNAGSKRFSTTTKLVLVGSLLVAVGAWFWLRNQEAQNIEKERLVAERNKEADAAVRKEEGRPYDLDIGANDHPKTAALKRLCSMMLQRWEGDADDRELVSLVNKVCAIDFDPSRYPEDKAQMRAIYYKYIGTRFQGRIFDELSADIKHAIGR